MLTGMKKWQWILQHFTSKLWLRASLFCVVGILTALVAVVFKDMIPDGVPRKVGAEAVDSLLSILANSMLVVTTFSLSTMVTAYTAATSNLTPRATQLLLQDRTAQNALSVFIGAFLFSLVGMIALSMKVYGDNGRLILFAVTLLVILTVVGVLVGWINYLASFGRVSQTIDLVEEYTVNALNERVKHPYMGGNKLKENFSPDDSMHPLVVADMGYVQYIDMQALSDIAFHVDMEMYLMQLPGAFNDGKAPLLYTSKVPDEATLAQLLKAIDVGDTRSFAQDPRFGLVIMSEMAGRALSSGINDFGTAIDVVGTLLRTLAPWVSSTHMDVDVTYPRVHVPALRTEDLFEDAFTSLARDGAGVIEVGVRLQKAYASLAQMGDDATKAIAKTHSAHALAYAKQSNLLPAEKEKLEALAL